MRKQCMIWLIVTACLAGVLAFGQSKRSSRRSGGGDRPLYIPEDNIKVDLSLQRSPVYSTDGRKNRIGSSAPENMRQWLMAEIMFSFVHRNRHNHRSR